MSDFITNISIRNFKSIKKQQFDCKRINIFIGKPNVGKSNLLEAIGLFSLPYHIQPDNKQPGNYCISPVDFRYEKIHNLFYDHDRKNSIGIETNLGIAAIRYHMNQINKYDIVISNNNSVLEQLEKQQKENYNIAVFQNIVKQYLASDEGQKGTIEPFYSHFSDDGRFNLTDVPIKYRTPVRKYSYKKLSVYSNHFSDYLLPDGVNLFTILESAPSLFAEVNDFFEEYGLDLVLVTPTSENLVVQKKIKNKVYQIPFSLTADTLKRIIFHFAAVESNDKSIILFEEPETHSFPPYISLLTDKIIENKSNQFFITTHSPYLLTPFIEKCSASDVNIFICIYENYETKIRALEETEIQNIMDTGIDLFFNISAFQK